jgi:hypothetical protein
MAQRRRLLAMAPAFVGAVANLDHSVKIARAVRRDKAA